MRSSFNHRFLYSFLSVIIVLTGTLIAIRFASGQRINPQGGVANLGLLSANSFPSGAQIYVDGKLFGATDHTSYLEPGNYHVKIEKDGYSPWSKDVRIESSLVTQTNAELFRRVPRLTPLTFAGVEYIHPSPNGERLVFYTSSASATTKNGLYVLDLSNNFFSNVRDPRLIVADDANFNLKDAVVIWSPDSTQLLVADENREVLIDANKTNVLATVPDVGFQTTQIVQTWERELAQKEQEYLNRFPPEFVRVATTSATAVTFSPDRRRAMYVATATATLPTHIIPAVPAISSQPQTRTLTPGRLYIYDREEDTNFQLDLTLPATATRSALLSLLTPAATLGGQLRGIAARSSQLHDATATAQLANAFRENYSTLYSTGVQWHPGSRHVVRTEQDSIYIQEYDNTNLTRVFASPSRDHFVYPWPDGSKLMILTSFSPDSPQNLYAIELK